MSSVGDFSVGIRKKFRDELNDLADIIATGGCKTFEEYHRMVGKIEGVAIAERILIELAERVEKSLDDF